MEAPLQPAVSNESVVGAYDRLAGAYDRVVAPLEAGTRRRALDLLSVAAGDRVLEVGCGPGHALGALARRAGEAGHVTGLDAAPGMLARARERLAGTPAGDRVDLVRGDARSLPVATDAVDRLLVEDALELFAPAGRRETLAECRRVLAPDGLLCVVTMERDGTADDPFVRAYEWLFEHVPGYERLGCRPIYARRALREAGFAVERQERHRRGGVWPIDILLARPDGGSADPGSDTDAADSDIGADA